MSAEATINDIINSAINTANEKTADSSSALDYAMSLSQGYAGMGNNVVSFTPTATAPAVNIPSSADGANDVLFNSSRDAMLAQLKEAFVSFFATYFPSESTMYNSARDWVAKALTQGGTGLAPHIEAQIWQRDRARLIAEGERAEREVMANWASRGFPLPPGAAAHQVSTVRQDLRNKLSDASRDIAIKQAQMEIENVRFAVQTAIEHRINALNAAVNYIKALADVNDVAIRLASSKTDAQARLISAASEYFRARISFDELRFRAVSLNAELRLKSQQVDVDSFNKSVDRVTSASVAAAEMLGRQAAAALSSMHASVNLVNVTNR